MSIFDIIAKKKTSTAIYPNRIKDKETVERKYQIWEFGNESTVFFTLRDTPIFKGYTRIVYGDHGPYVEFKPDHAIVEFVRKFNNTVPEGSYYEWMTVNDESDIKIYRQLRDVKNLPNPPSGGFRGNRVEGYADYIPGMYYVSPKELKRK